MGAIFVSILGYGLSSILTATGLVFFCVTFTDQVRGANVGAAWGLGIGLLTMAFLAATATAKLTGAI
jgi:uncharacterized membrane protein